MLCLLSMYHLFFFFNDTATTEIYTLSLHDALPIFLSDIFNRLTSTIIAITLRLASTLGRFSNVNDLLYRSEEHTSELQSQSNLVCRLLLEKKKKKKITHQKSTVYIFYDSLSHIQHH